VASQRETRGGAHGLCRGCGCHGRSRRGGSSVHGSRVRGSVRRLAGSKQRPPRGDSRAAIAQHHHTPVLAQRRHRSVLGQRRHRPVLAQHRRSDGPCRDSARHGGRASSRSAAVELERSGATVLGFVDRSEARASPGPHDCSVGVADMPGRPRKVATGSGRSTVEMFQELSGRPVALKPQRWAGEPFMAHSLAAETCPSPGR
jgi:hypothetical protein